MEDEAFDLIREFIEAVEIEYAEKPMRGVLVNPYYRARELLQTRDEMKG